MLCIDLICGDEVNTQAKPDLALYLSIRIATRIVTTEKCVTELASVLRPPAVTTSTTPSQNLVSTKLYPPRLRASHLARPDLISLLENEPDRRLTLICAPAGYGKSTLIAQWLDKASEPSAWVSLEASDNDPRSFFTLVVSAIQSIDRGLAAGTEALLSSRNPIEIDALVQLLIEEISETTRPFVLVLDDYHVIEALEIHWAVDLLLQHMPLSMQLVLISRTEPPLQLARLRANGEVVQLERQDLAFSDTETFRFFHDSLGLDLTPSEVSLLHQRTEGWVAGLYLAGFSLRGQPRERIQQYVEDFVGNAHVSDRYLWEEVLQNQSEEIRSFLVRTSILDRFSASLCDAVTNSDESERIIRLCDRENLFIIGLDEHGTWYRYHHLFAENLRDRLARTVSDDEIQELHRRACKWLEENGFLEDSIRHAIAGHAWDHAIRLLEVYCTELFERDLVADLRTWLEGLPPNILERSPRLSFLLAWSLGRTGRWSEAIGPLRVAEEAWMATDDRHGQGLLMLWHSGQAVYALQSRKAEALATRALELLPQDDSVARVLSMMTIGIACLNHGEPARAQGVFADVRKLVDAAKLSWLRPFEAAYSAIALAQSGKLQESAVLCRQVIQKAGEKPTEIWAQVAFLQLGLIHIERNQLVDAQRFLRKADDLAETTRALHWRARIRTGLARIAWARGEFEEAFAEMEQAIAFGSTLSTLQEVKSARAVQAEFWISSYQLGLARRWADSCDLDPYLPPEYERNAEYLAYIRLLIREDRADLALKILENIKDRAETDNRTGDLVEALLLSALARKASESHAKAIESLEAALDLGERWGYVRTFVDEGEQLAPLLRYAVTRGNHRDYARRLLEEIEGLELPAVVGRPSTSAGLSEREVEVLRFVAAGLSNRDIGQRLFISEKTVKSHLSNILSKLETTNRTQAVDRARRLGLL